MGARVQHKAAATTTTTADKAEAEKPASGGWGGFSGGFSDVAVTDGFGNASWGAAADGDSGGFGSFSNNAEFNVEAIQSEAKLAETVTTTTNAATSEAAQAEDDNGTYTLKPIVQLEEVNVNSARPTQSCSFGRIT